MEAPHHDRRPCAHCGGTIAADATTCADCGRAYIPDPAHDDTATADFGATATDRIPPPLETPSTVPPPASSGSGRSPEVTAESRNWAVAAHASALAGVLLGGLPAFLGPLVIWLLRRDAHDPFATAHARHALNFNLSVIIYSIAAVVLSIVTLGLLLLVLVPLGLVAFVGYLVVTIRATLAASRGEGYRYPFALPLVR